MTARKAAPARTPVAAAVKSGDRRAALVALRDQLAERLDRTASARDATALARQLAAILAQLGAQAAERSKGDELREKRAQRRAAAGFVTAASGSRSPGRA